MKRLLLGRKSSSGCKGALHTRCRGEPIIVSGEYGDMGPDEVQKFCALDEAGRTLLRNAAAQLNLSARAYHRVLKLAGSPLGAIADLAGEESIRPLDLAEALQYRPRSGM